MIRFEESLVQAWARRLNFVPGPGYDVKLRPRSRVLDPKLRPRSRVLDPKLRPWSRVLDLKTASGPQLTLIYGGLG